MAADPIIYCLERLTDFREFERLCSAFLAGFGYSAIDPLGGTGDKGRDAVIWPGKTGEKVVFAFTVRADWDTKLLTDSKRIQAMAHDPATLVFVCTQSLSATEKDWAQETIAAQFGWKLDLFDLERLRAQLAGQFRHLLAQHPGIFAPPIFPRRGGVSVAESRDTILIDHVESDRALAIWLNRRLSAAGFRTWCNGIAPLAGEDVDASIRELLDSRAVQYLPIISMASLQDGPFLERCTLAGAREGLALPCSSDPEMNAGLPSRLSKLKPADFSISWAKGIAQVLERLNAQAIDAELGQERGRQIALRDFVPNRVTGPTPERVFANVFRLKLPQTMLAYDLDGALSTSELSALRLIWAFCQVGATRLLSFTPPPVGSRIPTKPASEFVWSADVVRDGKKTADIAKELAGRSLDVVLARTGLRYCEDRRVYYFPRIEQQDWVQPIRHVDGRKTTVSLTGQRTKGFGERASPFLYQLCPRIFPHRDPTGAWSASVTIYVRTTDMLGQVFEGKEIGRRRKVVGKSWWNQQWLARLLGVVQALESSEGLIQLGTGRHELSMETTPMEWLCPVGLDLAAMGGTVDIGEELASLRSDEHDEDSQEQVDRNVIASAGGAE